MSGEAKRLSFLCHYCRTELDESQIFELRGQVCCEKCTRDYDRDRPTEEVESRLQTRQKNALAWLERNRKSLEKRAVRYPDAASG